MDLQNSHISFSNILKWCVHRQEILTMWETRFLTYQTHKHIKQILKRLVNIYLVSGSQILTTDMQQEHTFWRNQELFGPY